MKDLGIPLWMPSMLKLSTSLQAASAALLYKVTPLQQRVIFAQRGGRNLRTCCGCFQLLWREKRANKGLRGGFNDRVRIEP